MPDEVPIVKYPARRASTAPEDNRHNAWYRKSTVKAPQAAAEGRSSAEGQHHAGRGADDERFRRTLEGFVPDFDATIVTRMLDAGAEIAARCIASRFACREAVTPTRRGHVHNPHKMGLWGGSSSGSAVVVALGEVDMAIGGRPGRVNPNAVSFSGRVRNEADLGPRCLTRHHADRDFRRSSPAR